MWRICCPTVLPLTSDVTLRLLSQWPPLKSNFPSWDTTNRWAVTSTPGENGPDRNLWVLQRDKEYASWCVIYFKGSAGQLQTGCETLTVRDSLWTGYSGVFDEGEIVGYVLVIGQPAVSSHQAVVAQRYLDEPNTHYLWEYQTFHNNQKPQRALKIMWNVFAMDLFII